MTANAIRSSELSTEEQPLLLIHIKSVEVSNLLSLSTQTINKNTEQCAVM
jgi:hypothetical protein